MTTEEVKDIKLMDLVKYLYVMKKTEEEAKSLELSFVISMEGKKYNCKCSVELEECE